MRNFFITWLEWLLGLFVILAFVGLAIAVWMTATSGVAGAWINAAAIAISGFVGIILTFGMVYVLLAIQANTRRTAESIEAMFRQSDRRSAPVSGPAAATSDAAPKRYGPPVVRSPDAPRR